MDNSTELSTNLEKLYLLHIEHITLLHELNKSIQKALDQLQSIMKKI